MQELFRLLKTKTDFSDNGAINTEKQNMFQEISQQLLNNKHSLTLGQFM
jgi:hypothetical protein